MKFGVREICDVVLKAKAAQKVGNKIFYKDEPVIYFDTLKTSSIEGAATTVYAQGGKGNPRLVAWEGERTVTFTMEDALISPESFSILSGAGLIAPTDTQDNTIKVHVTERTADVEVSDGSVSINLDQKPYYESGEVGSVPEYVYVMLLDNGEVVTEPFLIDISSPVQDEPNEDGSYTIRLREGSDLTAFKQGCVVLVDYYTAKTAGVQQINISADKFGGNYYLEADTLFRDQNGVDMPATFIIPNCKIQSNFTFNMAASGDPSTFTFTMDAFPDYTRFDKTKKVLASIQMIETSVEGAQALRDRTKSAKTLNDMGEIIDDPEFTLKQYGQEG